MDITPWIQPLGITTYSILAATVISGRFRARLRLKLIHHKRLAYLAMILATIHGALVLIFSID